VDSCPDEAKIIRAAREVNDHKPKWVLEQIKQKLDEVHTLTPLKARSEITIACLGVAFKPDIDDLRESPALQITKQVMGLGCQVMIIEPNIDILPQSLDGENAKLAKVEDAIASADVIAILVNHSAFKEVKTSIKSKLYVVDAVGYLA
jgi:UDP-N-acetyl-D-mannosaminuronic acid dehydrogenase